MIATDPIHGFTKQDSGGGHRRVGDTERNAKNRRQIRARTLIATRIARCHECPVLRVRGAPFRSESMLRAASPHTISGDHNSSVSGGNESWTCRPNHRQRHNARSTGHKTQATGCGVRLAAPWSPQWLIGLPSARTPSPAKGFSEPCRHRSLSSLGGRAFHPTFKESPSRGWASERPSPRNNELRQPERFMPTANVPTQGLAT
jgi:hypothetical protein